MSKPYLHFSHMQIRTNTAYGINHSLTFNLQMFSTDSAPPSKPEVVDWGEDFAELKWKAGDGAEPTSYKVRVVWMTT